MENITKPSIGRLARRAGVKSISDPCHDSVRALANYFLHDIISAALLVNDESNTKTIMPSDIYKGMQLRGYNVTQSTNLGTSTCAK